jgi:hypothetical protein
MPRAVTPAGVRAGEPGALAGLIELRGSAVLAYACAILAPEAALEAAAHAMARFRSHVVGATDVRSLSPDAIVLRAVRESSAERVRHPAASGGTLRRLTRRGGDACEMAPRLIAARANHDLSHQDAVRLDQHLASCPGCRALRERFRDGERAYVETAGNRLREGDARALLLALAGAGPLAAATPEAVAAEALDLLRSEAVPPESVPPQAAPAPPQAAPPQPAPPPEAAPPEPAPSEPAPSEPAPPEPAPSEPAPSEPAPPQPAPPEPGSNGAPRPEDAPPSTGAIATTPGRVSFGRRTIVIRSGMHASGPATPEAAHPSEAIAPPDAPEQAGAAEEPPPPDKADDRPPVETGEPNEPAADDWPPPQAPERPVPAADDWPPPQAPERPVPAADDWPPAQTPERPAPAPEEPAPASAPEAASAPEEPAPASAPEEPAPASASEAASAPEEPAPASEAGDTRLVPALDGGPGAPPDGGTLARIIPGVLIVMAIGIALLVAGIVGIDSTPATTDDIDPPSLREPANELDTTGTLRAPAAPGAEAAPNAD